LPEFTDARLLEETIDQFSMRVELAVENVVGSYSHGEQDVCIVMILNGGWLNRVFEQTGMPYVPLLEPGSKTSKEAMRKRRNDVGTGPVGKRAKVSVRKMMAPKAPAAPKGTSAALSKTASLKVVHSHAKSVPKASAASRVSVSLKAGVLSKAVMPKSVPTLAVPKARVLRINTGTKRPSAKPLHTPKGKQERVDVALSSAAAPIRRVIVRP
jgi:hypothetical protein